MAAGDSADADRAATGSAESPLASSTVVLIVDGDPAVRESFTDALEPRGYTVRTAVDAPAARARLDESVDIVLLERQLPEASGEALLSEIRSQNLDCRVALVTAVDPDFDILAIDCDDYLVKPVDGTELVETVERLAMLEAYNRKQRRLSSLRVKRNVLEVEKDDAELEASEEFGRLERRIETLQADIEALSAEFDAHLGYDE